MTDAQAAQKPAREEDCGMRTPGTNNNDDAVLAKVLSVDRAAEKAYRLIEDYADRYFDDNVSDEHDVQQNPWNDPERMHRQLQSARDELNDAWNTKLQTSNTDEASDRDFRAMYIDLVTDAFADSLQSMQQNSSVPVNLDVLADCLQSGMDLYNERDLLYYDQDDEDDHDRGTQSVPVHQRIQTELGITPSSEEAKMTE